MRFDAATGSTFYRLPRRFWGCFEELVRRKVLRELRERKLISEKRHKLLLSWRHSGFSVFVGDPIPLATSRASSASPATSSGFMSPSPRSSMTRSTLG